MGFNQMLFDSPLTCLLTCLSYGVKYFISSTQVLDPYLKSSITECSQPITSQTLTHSALGRPTVPSRLDPWIRIAVLLPLIIFDLNTRFPLITFYRHSHIISVYNTPSKFSRISHLTLTPDSYIKGRAVTRPILLTHAFCCGRSQWPRGLRRRSAAARLLRSWVLIPPGAWMFVCCECCVLSGRGLCDELITRPEESYRM